MVMVLYHVCRNGWDGYDLRPLTHRRVWSDETAALIAAAWPDCDPAAYYHSDGCEIHCHSTLAEAREFAREYGGDILAVDAAGLSVSTGREYPHPVIRGDVSRERITVVN